MPPKKAAAAKAAPTQQSRTSSRPQPAKKATAMTTATPKTSKRKAADAIEEPKSKKAKAVEALVKTTKKTAAAKSVPVKKTAAPKAASKAAASKPAAKGTKKASPSEAAAKKTAASKAPAKKPAAIKTAAKAAPAAKSEPKAKKAAPKPKALPTINKPPTQKLDIFVFGEGSSGELGLGSVKYDGKMPIDVKRPRINENLSAKTVGVVQIAVGGMHCAALTHDNKILTWGVNDQGALGRDTTWSGGLKDIDAKEDSDSDSDDDDDTGMNPRESTPTEIDPAHFPEGTIFASLVASDSATFALTTEGRVYGWGTFRGNDGILGFRAGIDSQRTPMLIPELKRITCLATGTNHVLAVNTKGKVFGWGAGEQNQLARRVVSRTAMGALVPREFGLQRKNITYVACGDYHSFALDNKGNVYSWGLNTFGQTGIPKGEDEDDNAINVPTLVESLNNYDIKQIAGGAHHTLSCTKTGEVLIWGRIDNAQGGMDVSKFPKEKLFFDEHERPRYLAKPHTIPDIDAAAVSAANDTCLVITNDGKAYSWGFSGNYQTGQGTEEDIKEAIQIANSAVAGKKLVFAGAGGQFSVLAGVPKDEQMTNGI